MSIQEIIEKYQDIVIQIESPGVNGTGFYLKSSGLIVTNHHVTSYEPEVAIAGKSFEKIRARVLFTDSKHDLSFIGLPDGIHLPGVPLGDYATVKDGDTVLAIGHPYGLKYSATKGVVSKTGRVKDGIAYIQIDASINPGNSGGPLVNERAEVIGVNTFIIRGAENLGFALPVSYLISDLEKYKPYFGEAASACPSCDTLVRASDIENGKYCPVCGTEIKLPLESVHAENLTGVSGTIEHILQELGKDTRLARVAADNWEVKEGSSQINIIYNRDTRFISLDARLCTLPADHQKIKSLYQYLLTENGWLKSLSFGCQQQHILLSGIIFDADLYKESGKELFRNHFRLADHYDDLLKKQFDCRDIMAD